MSLGSRFVFFSSFFWQSSFYKDSLPLNLHLNFSATDFRFFVPFDDDGDDNDFVT